MQKPSPLQITILVASAYCFSTSSCGRSFTEKFGVATRAQQDAAAATAQKIDRSFEGAGGTPVFNHK